MTKCLVTEDALVPAVLCAFFAILLVPPALRVLASLFGRGDRTTIAEPRKAGPEWERDDGSRLHPITSFGAWGRADGCLNSPRFLLPVEGGVLVADSGNDRLQIFTADGSHVRTIQGSRPGHPTGLATDGTHVWVADSSNCSVTKIVLKDGAFITRTGSYGAGVGQFSAPEGLALAQVRGRARGRARVRGPALAAQLEHVCDETRALQTLLVHKHLARGRVMVRVGGWGSD